MSDEWFFIQSMKRKAKERQLDKVQQEIKEANQKVLETRSKLNAIPLSEQKQHPLRFEWLAARTLYWDKIAEMRDIEHGKSVIDKDT